jgi:hypothetical protein
MGGTTSMRVHAPLATVVVALAGATAGCGERAGSPDKVEAQLEKQFGGRTEFVECDQDGLQAARYRCTLETSSDRYRYVATCPSPGVGPCVIRRTGAEFK